MDRDDGDRVVLMTFGGGLAWGSMVVDWAPLGPPAAATTPVHATTSGS